jgi:alpha-galactosidase
MKTQNIVHTAIVCWLIHLATPAIVSEATQSDPSSNRMRHELTATPPMGWNSWNQFGKRNINETIVRDVMDAMVQTGLRDAGYNTIVVDGGWRDTQLGPGGELVSHPEKFPGGMKALADYAHKHGFKFGIHVVPGTHDCGGDPVGGMGNETTHVRQFVEWGIDFIKLDKCQSDFGWSEELLEQTYRNWSKLLSNCGRDIIFNICAYRYRSWYPEVSHMARTTSDISALANTGWAVFDEPDRPFAGFLSVMAVAELNDQVAGLAGNGYWNDPDMMVVGSGHGLTLEQQKSHFALWCVMSSPLFLGNDPRNMTEDELSFLKNPLAIRINQDRKEQGLRMSGNGRQEVWVKQLSNGEKAVVLLNRHASDMRRIKLVPEDLGIAGSYSLTEVYTGERLGTYEESSMFEVEGQACKFFLVSPQSQ